jgi:hypothetical protein
MKHKTYSIFGAGASGLYTAWRLLNGKPRSDAGREKQLQKGDVIELYDWGNYDFTGKDRTIREAGARVCTWHYKDDPENSYLEVGGMRYARWDTQAPDANGGAAPGHRLVTTVISQLGLDPYVVPFNESADPLYYMRSKNYYLSEITSRNPAPYNPNLFAAGAPPDNAFGELQNLSPSTESASRTRAEWNAFYQHGQIEVNLPASSIFKKGDQLKDIGYWNLMYDQFGSEGYNYAADGNGYSSNVINWNAAVAFQANNEFTPGTNYFTITTGYSGMFVALYQAVVALAAERGVELRYIPDTRLQSIYVRGGTIHYTLATRAHPWRVSESRTTEAAWLAMPRHSIELVAQGSRYSTEGDVVDVLNAQRVRLYLEAAIMQPSYKVGMFFDTPWWETATYPAKLTAYIVTQQVIAALRAQDFPTELYSALENPAILNVQFASGAELVAAVEKLSGVRLTVRAEEALLGASLRNTIGPSMTDTPIRMTVYFGNNAKAQKEGEKPVYGMLASYDDETFTNFWQELEIEPNRERHQPRSEDIQTLDGPRKVPDRMLKMLLRQIAELHYGPNVDYTAVPAPLEARYMDWSLPPFNAGYHAWAAHFDIADVQEKIRKPTQLIKGADADIFIVGEAYSNDQAWVEGAYCTAESVLNDFFDIEPLIDDTHYPFICKPVPAPTETAPAESVPPPKARR